MEDTTAGVIIMLGALKRGYLVAFNLLSAAAW